MADFNPTPDPEDDKTAAPSVGITSESPSEMLKPGSELHEKTLKYLLDRLLMSEKKMGEFYARWSYNEKRIQAYIDLPNWEKELKNLNDKGAVPSAVRIVVPYSYATISTIVTFLAQVFFGSKPMLQVGVYKGENAKSAQLMEQVLQHQSDHTRLVSTLFQFLQDTQYYNLAVMKCFWTEERGQRTVWKPSMNLGPIKIPGMGKLMPSREERLIYQGNEVESIDPFMFFPDPRVPMSKVNRKGEFIFWRTFTGHHDLQKKAWAKEFFHVKSVGSMPKADYHGAASERSIIADGESNPARASMDEHSVKSFVQLDECSIIIVPKDMGLGESDRPEHWVFTIANKRQIIRAEPLNLDHGMHPIVVSEPYGGGYGFGHAGVADMMGPLQDLMSWLVDSHVANVRTVLNNMFIVDPSRIEMQDLANLGPAKHIRLKRAAIGQDVRGAIQQLPVQDVTKGHIGDLQTIMALADTLTGVSDNMRGIQASGGRKTATEVRTSSEAGSSRMAALARIISAQGMVDLTTQMSVNTQQLLDEEMWIAVTGEDGKENPLRVSGDQIAGDFSFPVNDGTLPLDRVAMLDVWKEIFLASGQDPELQGKIDRMSMFKWMAELGGAKNFDKFVVQTAPDEDVERMAEQGNIIPANGPRPGGQTPGVASNPGARLAGGL
tara:strand:+ start:3306 stop:5294 length:1989 start_codon:yes stop_codon:yes gene_type:complete